MKLITKNKYLFLLLIIGIIAYFRWFSFNIFANGDWSFSFSNSLKNLSFNYVWFNLNNFGSVSFTIWRFPVNFLQSSIANLGYGTNISEKLFIFWPTIIFANIFSFLLFKKILKSNIGAFIGAIIFNYNTYFLISSGAFLLYAATPWVLLSLLSLIKALETGKKYLYVISGLTLFLAGSYDFRVAYIGVFILFFYSFYYFFSIKNLSISVKFLKSLFSSFITFFVFGLLNIYWILPMIKLGSLTSNVALSRGLFGNEFLNILYSITLFHPFWTGTTPAWFIVEPILSYFWFIPVFVFLGLWLNKKNKNILFFGLIALLGIFLTKQAAHPFPNIYPWLFNHIIGFNAFREASKFYFLIALGYAVLIGGFISWIWQNWTDNKRKLYGKYMITFIILIIFLWNIKPVLSGEFRGVFIPRYIPNDYLIVKDFILKDKDYSRTLWIPNSSTWSIYTVNHPTVDTASALSKYNYWIDYINKLPIDKYKDGQLMIKTLTLPLSNNLLDISSVKYVFVPIRDIANDADFFIYYGESRSYYINELNRINWLRRINIGTKDVIIYENFNYKPHIYLTDEKETINKEQTYKTIDYKFVNPTEYTFSFKNISNPFYLNFSEAFDTGWNIRVGSFNWFDVLKNKNYFISDKYHFQNDATLNSYLLDPKSICRQFACKQNADGSYDISGTLYFAPQSYMYLGLIISGSTLIIIFGYLGFIGFNSLKRKYERKNK